jgi:hypothetical protein
MAMPNAGRTTWRAARVALAVTCVSACSSTYVWIPPRVDLQPLRPTGLVTFTIENAQGSLHELATQRFADAAFSAQDQIQILQLGDADSLLTGVGASDFTAAAVKAIGEAHGVPAMFVGHLVVSTIKPSGGLPSLSSPHLEASVSVELTVRLLSAETGATMWSRSARATETIGQVGLAGGKPYFGAEHPDEAYGKLVDELVDAVTTDLRPRRVKK